MAARAVMIFFPNLAKFFSYCHGQNKLKTRASVLSRVCNKNSIKKNQKNVNFGKKIVLEVSVKGRVAL